MTESGLLSLRGKQMGVKATWDRSPLPLPFFLCAIVHEKPKCAWLQNRWRKPTLVRIQHSAPFYCSRTRIGIGTASRTLGEIQLEVQVLSRAPLFIYVIWRNLAAALAESICIVDKSGVKQILQSV